MEEMKSGRQSPHNVRESPDKVFPGGLGQQTIAARMKLSLIKCEWSNLSMVGNFVDERNLSDMALNPFDRVIEVKDLRDSMREFEEALFSGGQMFI
jgi:hypothetical protein